MKEMDFDTYWMLGVIAVMVVYGLIAAYGINKNNTDKDMEHNNGN